LKTLIIYASKYGATAEIAKRIGDKINGSSLYDIKGGNCPPLDGFDNIIIGSPLYVGNVRKEIKEFIAKNESILKGKKFALFLSGCEPNKGAEYFKNNFPEGVLQAAKAAVFVGGLYDPKKSGFLDKLLLKIAAKKSDYFENIDGSKIDKLVEAMGS
jgi:menaquinone-dependent protoporphyrinogen oxidase